MTDDSPHSRHPRAVFYAAAAGDMINAHHCWARGEDDATEVSITFSSQIEQYATDIGARLWMVSPHNKAETVEGGAITVEHLPKPSPDARGVGFYIRELRYVWSLLGRARRINAEIALIDSGAVPIFMMWIFPLFGIPVAPILHNTLWPNGFPRRSFKERAYQFLEAVFFRFAPKVTLGVSDICLRQVKEIAGEACRPLMPVRAQFRDGQFDDVGPPPPSDRPPFRVMFIGRIYEAKGVFDIVEAASIIEARAPGRVLWTICGRGPHLEQLRATISEKGLDTVVETKGWVTREELIEVYNQSHCAIVPTRRTFAEGLAMTAIEATMASRPVFTNKIVPALEHIQDAAVECEPESPQSIAKEVLALANDPARYQQLVAACPTVIGPFLDQQNGLTAVLKRALAKNQ